MSNTNYFTVQDVKDSVEKFGEENILTCFLYEENWTKEKMGEAPYRDNKQNKKKNDCTWVPLRFRHCDGTLRRLNLKINKVLTTSKAKFPAKVSKESAQFLHIAFKRMSLEEIRGGDFVPREMDSKDKQLKENKRVEDNILAYKESTDAAIDALISLNNSYERIANDLITKTKKDVGFTVKKSKGDVTIFSIIQKTITDPETEEVRLLDEPMVRVKLMAGKNSRKIGTESWNNDTKSWVFKPNVLDSRKMKKEN